MPIIGNVGRRSFKVRFLNVAIHVVLIAGAATMVYPFMIMLSGSVKSAVDSKTLSAIPEYFYDDEMLFRKWIETKYNEGTAEHGFCYRKRLFAFDKVRPPHKRHPQRVKDWNAFLDTHGEALDEFHYSLGNCSGRGIKPELMRKFVEEAKAEPSVGGDIARFNEKYQTTFVSWDAVSLPSLNLLRRGTTGDFNPFTLRILKFARKQARYHFNYYSLDSFFVEQKLKPKYVGNIREMNAALGADYRSWEKVTLPRSVPDGGLREDWLSFVRTRLNLRFITVSEGARKDYQDFLRGRYKDVALYNTRYRAARKSFEGVPLFKQPPRKGVPAADWDYFVGNVVKPEHLGIVSTECMYRGFLREKYGTIERLIAAQNFGLESVDELALTEKFPAGNTAYEDDWTAFVDTVAEREWIRPDFAASKAYRDFVTEPYREGKKVDLKALNAALDTDFKNERDIMVSQKPPKSRVLAALWREFVYTKCPRDLLLLDVAKAEPKWREFIRGKYPRVAELNQHYAWVPAGLHEVPMPTAEVDYDNFLKTKGHAFWEFFTRNYAAVFETMVYNGRAIVNTIIYCGLAILCALIVNPMAAYALSRYKPPSQYKLLLFLMLTMAFPPMVLGIPNFLLLRQLGLLNTFAALILPGVANGYQIFLLKGFFDALPRELYESAQLDGASEWTMFWHITMATSKPILAVIALGAFRMAYANFMMAFIVCQSPKMWTMMVHIYQLMQRSNQGVSFAALVVAAVPTLLVFVFCQNIILRGIVVPTEK